MKNSLTKPYHWSYNIIELILDSSDKEPFIIESIKLTTSRKDEKLKPSTKRVFFGNIILYRHTCIRCEHEILSSNENYLCDCGHEYKQNEYDGTIYEIVATRRKGLPRWKKSELIKEQKNRCYWCERKFGVLYMKGSKIKSLNPCFDHIVPYSFSKASPIDGFVAACNFCNQFKSNMIFSHEDDCRKYLKKRWEKYLEKERISFLEDENGV